MYRPLIALPPVATALAATGTPDWEIWAIVGAASAVLAGGALLLIRFLRIRSGADSPAH